jgi:hypothetical protein
MRECACMLFEIFVLLAQGEPEHHLAVPWDVPLLDQYLHLGDVVAVRGLDAQVGTQVMGKAVAAVERGCGVAVR